MARNSSGFPDVPRGVASPRSDIEDPQPGASARAACAFLPSLSSLAAMSHRQP
eukprot:CAMPEP_0175302432 /NCGR_PEP_ID=MMETSP0093-20121207/62184_1 /TAXON_ID=311494 /ORGANISM="Alexandrium monilatum, Strain CCMP3105" /LENGTH=52 /DNA_ID=CAMNT_0016598745 /DNA_START=9 /DNA_END=165 /DNA_ORIENTATION=-